MTTANSPREQVDLAEFNTLHVSARARYFAEVHEVGELNQMLAWAEARGMPVLILGGGSNLVFTADYPGLVIRMCIRGRYWERIQDQRATLVLGAGENWHQSVLYAARSGYRGIENLALIPGTAGAAPVQNIGAYGVELCDSLESVTVLDRSSGQLVVLSCEDCRFAYRDSLFKQVRDRYVIIEIRLRLSRNGELKLGYRELAEYLGNTPASTLQAMDVAEAVMAIRRRKLPDPDQIPNAGSFFKNPVVSCEQYRELQARYPEIVGYPQEQGVKLAAGWLIDQSGWKGFRNERVGVHGRQALVLINHSGGSGRDIMALAEKIRVSVVDRFGVHLETEPGVVGGKTGD